MLQKRSLLLFFSLLNTMEVCQTDEATIELFGLNDQNYIWQKANTVFQPKNLIPSVKRRCSSIMLWACFVIPCHHWWNDEFIVNFELHQQIPYGNVRVSVCELKLVTKCVKQQASDTKYIEVHPKVVQPKTTVSIFWQVSYLSSLLGHWCVSLTLLSFMLCSYVVEVCKCCT